MFTRIMRNLPQWKFAEYRQGKRQGQGQEQSRNAERLLYLAICFLASALVLSPSELHAFDLPTQNYKIESGDTLYSLARQYGVSVNEIMRLNQLKSSTDLKPGMILKIPVRRQPDSLPAKAKKVDLDNDFGTHVVGHGETYYAIAQKYAMTVDELLEINGLEATNVLRQGQTLTVKARHKRTVQKKSPTKVSNSYWPVDGERSSLRGKVQGVRILATDGSFVHAVRDGKVMWQGPYRSYGVVALVVSDDGYAYLYGGNVHFLINNGQEVKKGDPIAKVDANVANQLAGQSMAYQGYNRELAQAEQNKAQVYFSVFLNGEFIDVDSAPRG